MNPDAPSLWRGPRWTLAPLRMQQTLSACLFGFAAMNLLHGAIADSFGRRPVTLTGLAVFTLASIGCAIAPSIGTLIFLRAGRVPRHRPRGLAVGQAARAVTSMTV